MSDTNINLSPKTPRTPHSKSGKGLSASTRHNTNINSQFTILSPTLTPQSHKKHPPNVLSNRFKSPTKSTTSSNNSLYHNYLKTPEYTPKKTNRQLNFGSSLSVLNHSESNLEQPSFKSNSSSKFGGKLLFPVAHSTVGSGRSSFSSSSSFASSLSSNSHVHNLPSFGSSSSNILFDPFIQSEQDESDSNSESESEFPKLTKKRLNFASEDVLVSDDEVSTDKESITVVPSTPGDKIITFEMAQQWNNNSSELNKSDKESEIFHDKVLENPFIHTSSKRQKVSSPIESIDSSRFEHEIELIDKKGNKIYRQLTEEEKKFKPKRLFFDTEVPTTPKGEFKEPNLPILNRKTDSDYVNEIIKDSKSTPRKVINPFVTNSSSSLSSSSSSSSSSSTKSTISEFDTSLNTTITYINNKTGQQKVVPMDQEQLNIKPKKLNFD